MNRYLILIALTLLSCQNQKNRKTNNEHEILIPSKQQKAKKIKIFHSIEEAIQKPDEVESLKLNSQKINKIPSEVFLFPNLKILKLYNNKITKIPEDIEKLSNLEELYLNDNKLKTLPHNIAKLKKLKILWLSKNNFSKKVFEKIFKIKSLEYLSLGNGDIDNIPHQIENLINLKKIDLDYLKIKKYPKVFPSYII